MRGSSSSTGARFRRDKVYKTEEIQALAAEGETANPGAEAADTRCVERPSSEYVTWMFAVMLAVLVGAAVALLGP